MILNSKQLVVAQEIKPKQYYHTTHQPMATVPAPPHTGLGHLLQPGEKLILYTWEDMGPVDQNGNFTTAFYRSGVEVYAWYQNDNENFQSCWTGARNDWIQRVKDVIRDNVLDGINPEEVWDFGLTPTELDFVNLGADERFDWGIRNIKGIGHAATIKSMLQGQALLANWPEDEFPAPTQNEQDEWVVDEDEIDNTIDNWLNTALDIAQGTTL